jgi:dipeptidyl aminopeptidase/acylaminoacyl peptidase
VGVGIVRKTVIAMGALTAAAALAPGGGAAAAGPPARIAFNSGGRIFTIAADGTGRHRVAGPVRPLGEYEGNLLPDLSPNGARVAFTHLFTREHPHLVVFGAHIYVANVTGGGGHAVTHDRHAVDYGPQWSPDGDSLAFARIIETRSRLATKIVVTNSDGTRVHTVAKESLTADSGRFAYVWEPTWNPDGHHLVYTLVSLRNDASSAHRCTGSGSTAEAESRFGGTHRRPATRQVPHGSPLREPGAPATVSAGRRTASCPTTSTS